MAFDATVKKNKSENVSVGKPLATGAIFRLARPDFGSEKENFTPPASLQALDGYECLGFISEDGVENSFDTSATEQKVWGGDVVMSSVDSYSEKLKFKMVETSPTTQKAMWGDGHVTGTGITNMVVDHSSEGFDVVACYVILTLRGQKGLAMQVAPQAQISNIESITYNDKDLIGYEIELNCGAGSFENTKVTSRTTYMAQPSTEPGH